MTHPFALPDIADLIASFLNNKALFHCIQVSNQWHHVFFPYYWSVLSIPRTTSFSLHSLECLRQNASFVKVLSIDDLWDVWCFPILNLDLSSLHTLRVTLNRTDKQSGAAFVNLIRHHGHGLRNIEFNPQLSYSKEIPAYDVLSSLGDCCGRYGRITSLYLQEIPIQVDALGRTVRALLGQLNSFSIRRVRLLRDKTSLDKETPSWPIGKSKHLGMNNIRFLSIDDCGPSSRDPQDEYGLIVDCQQIQSLAWKNWKLLYHYQQAIPFVQDLQKGWWPFLERLHLPWTGLLDKELATIILAMDQRSLRELNVEGTDFGQLSTRALLWRTMDENCDLEREVDTGKDSTLVPHHRLALTALYLKNCDDLTGSMIQQILCSFPNLRRFNGTTLSVSDVISDPRSWICTQLEMLHLCFRLGAQSSNKENSTTDEDMSNIKSQSHVFLDRLQSLSQLEALVPLIYEESGCSSLLLSNRPDMELEVLSSLHRLKLVGWDNLNQLLRLEDAKLMVEIWPALEKVHLFNRSAVESEAAEFLKMYGIQCTDDDGRWR